MAADPAAAAAAAHEQAKAMRQAEDEQMRQAIAASLVAQLPRRADDQDADLQRALAASQVQDSDQTEEALYQSVLADSARLEEEQERRREEETRRHDEEQRRSAEAVNPRERALAAAEARARAVAAPPPSAPLPAPAAAAVPGPSVLPPRSGAPGVPSGAQIAAAGAAAAAAAATAAAAAAAARSSSGGKKRAHPAATQPASSVCSVCSARVCPLDSHGRHIDFRCKAAPRRPAPQPSAAAAAAAAASCYAGVIHRSAAEPAGGGGKKRARAADDGPRGVIHLDGPSSSRLPAHKARPQPGSSSSSGGARAGGSSAQAGSSSGAVVDLLTPPSSPTRNDSPAAPAPAKREPLLGYRKLGVRLSGSASRKLNSQAWTWSGVSTALSGFASGSSGHGLSGFLSAKPDKEALEPGSADGKRLVGRSVLYHWADQGWCSGVIEKANGDKSKTADQQVGSGPSWQCHGSPPWPLGADSPGSWLRHALGTSH